MTISEALNRIDTLKPNSYSESEKIKWLSILDGLIKKEIIDTHEGGESVVFNGYDDKTGKTTELLVPAPFDDIYVKWLESQIDYANAEYAKYNNSSIAYNNALSTYERYYNRHHMPVAQHLKFF